LAVEEHRTAGSGVKPERAVLVEVDRGRSGRPRGSRAGAAGARTASVRPDSDLQLPDETDSSNLKASGPLLGQTQPYTSTVLDAEESLAEFRELVASAAGLLLQR
jgi:hypothetical protein